MVIGYRENIQYCADIESWASATNNDVPAMLCDSRPNGMADRPLAQLLSDDCWWSLRLQSILGVHRIAEGV